jgi:hypothetical protein
VALGHGVRRRAGGGLRVRLSDREHQLLRSLPDQLRPLISDEDAPADLRARLFPRTYEDPLEELEQSDALHDALAEQRLASIDTFAQTLDGGQRGRFGWSIDLDADEADAWLSAVNDARLALGVVLGVTAESQWEDGPDPDEPASVALWYLGWLEEQIVQALMSSLADDATDPPPDDGLR